MKLDVIKIGDLNSDCLQHLTNNINEELNINLLPDNLQFIVPEIRLENQEDYVLSQFAKLVDSLFSGAQCSAVAIYRAIIDEMGRKIRITFDYTDWNRLINKKSLTSDKVNEVLTINSNCVTVSEIREDFNNLSRNLGWRTAKIIGIRRKVVSLCLKRSGFMTALDIDIVSSFLESGSKVDESQFDSDSAHIDGLIKQAKIDGLEDKISNPEDFLIEIIYFLLTS